MPVNAIGFCRPVAAKALERSQLFVSHMSGVLRVGIVAALPGDEDLVALVLRTQDSKGETLRPHIVLMSSFGQVGVLDQGAVEFLPSDMTEGELFNPPSPSEDLRAGDLVILEDSDIGLAAGWSATSNLHELSIFSLTTGMEVPRNKKRHAYPGWEMRLRWSDRDYVVLARGGFRPGADGALGRGA